MCIEGFNSWVPLNHRVATKFVNTSKAALYLRKGLRSHLNRKSEKYLKLTLTAESKIWIFRLAWTSYIYSSAFVALPLFLLLYHPQQFSLLQNIFLLFLRTGYIILFNSQNRINLSRKTKDLDFQVINFHSTSELKYWRLKI